MAGWWALLAFGGYGFVGAAWKRLNCRGWTSCSCLWPTGGASSMVRVGVRIGTVGALMMQPEMEIHTKLK